jgi:hypothetical protein
MIFKTVVRLDGALRYPQRHQAQALPTDHRLESGMRKLRIQVWWEIDGVFLRMLR